MTRKDGTPKIRNSWEFGVVSSELKKALLGKFYHRKRLLAELAKFAERS
jgi:hypothetical protein